MKAVVWSKDNCHACTNAKTLLEAMGYEIEEIKLVNAETVNRLKEQLPDARTVPQIFLDGEYIGGYDNLVKHFDAKSKV